MNPETRWALIGLTFALITVAPATYGSSTAPQSSPEDPWTLGYYIALARDVSPAADAARLDLEAARARADGAGSLPDPSITYGHYFEEVETRVGPQVARFGVRQRVPLFGKRHLAASAAGYRADSAAARTDATLLDVELAVTRAFAEYAYLARAIEITEERLSLLRSLEEVVRERYSSGEASYSDLMRAQVAVAQAEDALSSRIERRAVASSRLAASVGMSDNTELPLPEAIPQAVLPDEESAVSRFRHESPDLKRLDADVQAAREERRLAGRGFLPDLTLGVDYIVTDDAEMPVPESGKDPVIGMATLSIPLWFGKHDADIKAAEAAWRASERRREQRDNELTAALRSALFEATDARRREMLYHDRIVPDAEQSLASIEAEYRAGSADFESLIEAHQAVLEFRLAEQRARADVLVHSAEVARRVGASYGEELH